MWELDCEKGWVPKNWCFWTVVLEKTLESPMDCKEIQPVHSKGDQPWVFFGRNDAKAETPVLWPPHAKSWLTGKDFDAGRDWGQKGMTEDEMAGWHHWLDGRESEWTPGVGDGQGGLVCCRHDWATELNWLRRWGTEDFHRSLKVSRVSGSADLFHRQVTKGGHVCVTPFADTHTNLCPELGKEEVSWSREYLKCPF